jgi:ribosomal protein RSM22 (predicted rRNA methylase)
LNPKTFEDILLKYLSNGKSPAFISSELKAIASDIIHLSNLFTREREILPPQYLHDKRLRMAYILYFLPSNIYKIHLPLKELSLHPEKILSKKELKILDLGSGPGSTLLGVLDFFSEYKKIPFLKFTALDSVPENLSITKDIFELFKEGINTDAALNTVKINIEKAEAIPKDSYDIIILSNIINELFYSDENKIAKRASFLTTIIDKFLTPDGSCIIIEPALRKTTREMLMVRDRLIKEGFKIYSPCFMDASCPALLNPKDWCHEDIKWNAPDIIKRLERLTGLRRDSLKFSYLVLRKDKLSLRDILGNNYYRIVSEPLISKGKLEFYICGHGGRKLITRLDKDKTSSNEQFQKLQRGNIATFEGLIDEGNRLKVGKDTVVLIQMQ